MMSIAILWVFAHLVFAIEKDNFIEKLNGCILAIFCFYN
jgi:hypothetical protein